MIRNAFLLRLLSRKLAPSAQELAIRRTLALGVVDSCSKAMDGVVRPGTRRTPAPATHWHGLAVIGSVLLAVAVSAAALAIGSTLL